MKRYIKSARSESNYKNTEVIHVEVPKTTDAVYNFIRDQLIALSNGSEDRWYVHVDSSDEYTIYVNADAASSAQIKNLIEIRFKNIASVLAKTKVTTV